MINLPYEDLIYKPLENIFIVETIAENKQTRQNSQNIFDQSGIQLSVAQLPGTQLPDTQATAAQKQGALVPNTPYSENSAGNNIRKCLDKIDRCKENWLIYNAALHKSVDPIQKQFNLDMMEYSHNAACASRLTLLNLPEISGNVYASLYSRKLFDQGGQLGEQWVKSSNILRNYSELCDSVNETLWGNYCKYHSILKTIPGKSNNFNNAFSKWIKLQSQIIDAENNRNIPVGIIEGIIINEMTNFDMVDSTDLPRLLYAENNPILSGIPMMKDASLGIGQVHLITAELLEKLDYMPASSSREEVISRLLSDEINIYYIASILQYAADQRNIKIKLDKLDANTLSNIVEQYNGNPNYSNEIVDYGKIVKDYYSKTQALFSD